jgi:hypothetical protein
MSTYRYARRCLRGWVGGVHCRTARPGTERASGPAGRGVRELAAVEHRDYIRCHVGTVLNYHVRAEWWSVEGAYENWISTRKPPLFGTEPDARVWNLATAAPDAATYPVLDIGGGTGRNTLALAARGHPVEVVEMTPKFAEIIRAEPNGSRLTCA